MPRPRACDACSLRKVRCTGNHPCENCIKNEYNCSFAKPRVRPGPKGPRKVARVRLNRQLEDLRNVSTLNSVVSAQEEATGCGVLDLTAPAPEPVWASSFALSDVLAYLDIYNQRMYPVWPVVNLARLRVMFTGDVNDPEICALTFAVCASTGAQLRLDQDNSKVALSDRFAVQAEHYRSMYDYRESTTIEGILVPLFLHFYYGAKGKKQTMTLLLRESVTLCQLAGLDKEETYRGLNAEEESYRRRVFWLLYVTERGHAMQHGIGVCLSNSINLPANTGQNEPPVLQAFHSLLRLFAYVDGVLVDPKHHGQMPNRRYSREMLSRLQEQLRRHPECPAGYSETQRSDISITQQWLRMLVWQLSLRNVFMSRNPTDESMSFTYPADVAKDALQCISTVSVNAMTAHGPGMQIKLYDITNTLLDVINCAPLLSQDRSIQTRQILHDFCCLLAKLNSHGAQGLDSLQNRLAESNLVLAPLTRVPRLENDHEKDRTKQQTSHT